MEPPQLCLLLGLCLTALVYAQAVGFQFVYDDLTYIVRNPQIHSWSNLGSFFTRHLWASYAASGSYYRPVFQVWLLLNYKLFGLSPAGWHAATLGAHLLATLLVYRLLEQLGVERLAAAVAATIFGVHPVHLESAAWVAGANEPLMTALFIAAFLCHLRARAGERWWWGAALAFYALALLAKEAAAPLPAVVLAYEWTAAAESTAGGGRWRRAWQAVLRSMPYAAVTLLYLTARLHWQVGLGQPSGQDPRALWLTLPAILVFYLRHLVWPAGLSVFYHLPLVEHPGVGNFFAPALLLLAVVAGAIWLWRRSHAAAFALAWTALTMLPPIAGLPVFPSDEIVHDRYVYLPSAGLAILLGLGWQRWMSLGPRSRRVPLLAAGCLVCALGAATLYQERFWTNNLELFSRGVAVAPENVNANNQLANELFKRGRGEEALKFYHRSLRLDANDWATTFSLGLTEFLLGHYPDAELHLQRAIQLSGSANVQQYYYLGLARIERGEWQAAEPPLREAVHREPAAAGLHYALGTALVHAGNLPGAREEFEAELRVDPTSAAARQSLADVQKEMKAAP